MTLRTTKNLIFSKDNPAYAITPSRVAKGPPGQKTIESHDLTVGNLYCDLNFEDGKPVLSLRIMMTHHYSKVGN